MICRCKCVPRVSSVRAFAREAYRAHHRKGAYSNSGQTDPTVRYRVGSAMPKMFAAART